MTIEKFDDINRELLEERLPNAFDNALMVSKKAETMIYMALVKSLEQFSDVAIDIDANDPVCCFLDKWDRDGYIDGALAYGSVGDGKKRLACSFDLYGIRDTFETISTDLFGTISDEYARKLDNADEIKISSIEVSLLEKGFQKVNLPKKSN